MELFDMKLTAIGPSARSRNSETVRLPIRGLHAAQWPPPSRVSNPSDDKPVRTGGY